MPVRLALYPLPLARLVQLNLLCVPLVQLCLSVVQKQLLSSLSTGYC
jgi:hypothetical protein